MKLPSFQTLWQNINRVFSRFPLQFLLAIFSATVWWYLIDHSRENAQLASDLGKVLLCSNFAFTLLLAGDLFCEVNRYSNGKKWTARLIAISISIGIYFLINPFTNKGDLFRFFLMGFAFHLLVSFAPFMGKSTVNGFWQYNKTLFLRILTAAFYAAVLFAGLAIALFAIDGLFNAEINEKAYMKLFALVSAGFTSIFFLAGVPDDFSELETDYSYPKGLKIFTQYVLIPLMTIYLAILLVYEIKIILIWSLPKGIVSSLILGYAVFGILSLLLIHPIKDKPGNGWMKLFSKFFYLMMIPLVVLLILAIAKRTGNYGITEQRYVLMALAFWLSGILIYFLTSKKQNIKVIPISLCVLTLLLIYGPQSAFSVSKRSQLARLDHLMKSKEQKDVKERGSVVRYLVENHGLTALQPFTHVNLEEVDAKIEAKTKLRKTYAYEARYQRVDTAFAILKVKEFDDANMYINFSVNNANRGLIAISGYDAMFLIEDSIESIKQFNGTQFKVVQKAGKKNGQKTNSIELTIGDGSALEFDLTELSTSVYQQYASIKVHEAFYPSEKMSFTKETEDYVLTLIVGSMSGSYRKDKNEFEWLNIKSFLLIKKKR